MLVHPDMSKKKGPPGINEGKNLPVTLLVTMPAKELFHHKERVKRIRDKTQQRKKTTKLYLRVNELTQKHVASNKVPKFDGASEDSLYDLVDWLEGYEDERVMLSDGNIYTLQHIVDHTGVERSKIIKRLASTTLFNVVMRKVGDTKWASEVYTLSDGSKWSIPEIAKKIRVSHYCVSYRLKISNDVDYVFAPPDKRKQMRRKIK